ncbi:MAG: hypothetical protein HYR55_07460 [Acidobacteria bacterium]|nr:hypothetical protein [Acidobacteriota bacterium]MBI3655564.1 hypothetical protein [Acidobacteriota bacterium]
MDPITPPSTTRALTDAMDTTARSTRGSDLGRDDFLMLMLAQLKNQNPLSPQSGTEFVAQMAQFSSLDQLIGIKELLRALMRPITSAPEGRDTPWGRTRPT